VNAFTSITLSLPVALIGDIGGGELLLVLAATLMLFGGKKLPSIARTLGRTVEDLRRASQDFRDQLMNADRDLDRTFDDAPAAPDAVARRVEPHDSLPGEISPPGSPHSSPSPLAEAMTGIKDGPEMEHKPDSTGTPTAPAASPNAPEKTSRDLAG
jgi:sec-independent protein translocase protein TatA